MDSELIDRWNITYYKDILIEFINQLISYNFLIWKIFSDIPKSKVCVCVCVCVARARARVRVCYIQIDKLIISHDAK